MTLAHIVAALCATVLPVFGLMELLVICKLGLAVGHVRARDTFVSFASLFSFVADLRLVFLGQYAVVRLTRAVQLQMFLQILSLCYVVITVEALYGSGTLGYMTLEMHVVQTGVITRERTVPALEGAVLNNVHLLKGLVQVRSGTHQNFNIALVLQPTMALQ